MVSDKSEKKEEETKSKTLLQTLLEGPKGLELVENVDLDALQIKLLHIVSILMKSESKEETLEEKLIVDNALNLWMACVMYEPRLFDSFRENKGIASSDDFILYGLLLCPIEKIR